MKKVMLIAVAALAMTALVACNNNSKTAEVEDTAAATEQCDTTMCKHECGDSTAMCCKAEGMAEDTAACCKKAEGEKCCKAEGKQCPKEAAK